MFKGVNHVCPVCPVCPVSPVCPICPVWLPNVQYLTCRKKITQISNNFLTPRLFIIRSLCLFCAFEVQKPLVEKILSWWILGVNVLMAILCPPCSASAEHHEVFSFSEMHSFCRLLKISLIQSPALLLTRRALWAPSSRDVAFVNNFPRLFLVIPAFTALPIS